jgi:hypothetical protein
MPVFKHEKSKKLHSVTNEAGKFKQQLNMEQEDPPELHTSGSHYASMLKTEVKSLQTEALSQEWKNKPLHGKFPERLSNSDVDQSSSVAWLRSAGLKAETEGLLIAAQDQALHTKVYSSRIIGDGSSPLCRVCDTYDETVDHILSGCPQLAKTEYLERHNRIAKYIHWSLCHSHGIEAPEKWYEHKPTTVMENSDVTLLWDMPVATDRQISANRSDIIVKNKAEHLCSLIDISVPADKNTSVKTMEKISKYKDLEIEISRMWRMNTKTIPVIVGALGLIPKSADQHLCHLPSTVSKYEIQKIGLLGSAHILRRVLSIQ